MDLYTVQGFWWIIAGLLLILEFITPATVFIFPALAAVLVALLSFIIANPVVQFIVFMVLSVLFIMMIRPFFVTGKHNKGYKQGSDALIGKSVLVSDSIDNYTDQGRIKHGADYFPARSVHGNNISKDSWVRIIKVDGITVFVEEIKEEKSVEK